MIFATSNIDDLNCVSSGFIMKFSLFIGPSPRSSRDDRSRMDIGHASNGICDTNLQLSCQVEEYS